jgi:hypothetical protein
MCDSCHTGLRLQLATMCAVSDKGKPTERWRRKVTGLKSLVLHDSGTAGIQSAIGLPRCTQCNASSLGWRGGGDDSILHDRFHALIATFARSALLLTQCR